MSGGRSSRRPLVAGNWKMHLLRAGAESLCRALVAAPAPAGTEVVLFPGFPLLGTVGTALAGSAIAFGGQDLHPEERGAHTGDVSAEQLVDAGAVWVLCGHSERRQEHGEGDDLVARKAAAAARAGLRPMVCVGETAAERRAGRTFEVLDRQIAPLEELPGMVLAYEPVWAIGTGETATPEIAAAAHRHLRDSWNERFPGAGENLRILYGGSVTPLNADGLAEMQEIDGALVGGASLDHAKFLAIISSFAASRGLPRTQS